MTLKDKLVIGAMGVLVLIAFFGLQYITDASNKVAAINIDQVVKQSTVSIYMKIKLTDEITGKEKFVGGLASGFYVSKDGYIVTNYHVIKDTVSISIQNFDASYSDATLVGFDIMGDLAVLKVAPNKDIIPITWGDDKSLRYGDRINVIGNPVGNDFSLTSGIISNLTRNQEQQPMPYQYIQVDASMNPGNSGGPVLNEMNQVVAISDAIAAETGSNIGIGYVIPASYAKLIVDRIIKGEHDIKHGTIGLGYEFDFALDETTGLHKIDGILIDKIVPGLPAEKAGLQEGDVIIKINSVAVNSSTDLYQIAKSTNPGDILIFTIKRAPTYTKGHYETLEIKVTSGRTSPQARDTSESD